MKYCKSRLLSAFQSYKLIKLAVKKKSSNVIKDVTSEGVESLATWGGFQGIIGVTRGLRGAKSLNVGVMSFMDGLLDTVPCKKTRFFGHSLCK